MLFAVGIAGLISQKGVETGVNKIMCAVVMMLSDVRNGAGSGEFIFTGIVGLTEKMTQLDSKKLPSFESLIKEKLS